MNGLPPLRLQPMPRRLYFFPALLPVVEFVPWVLALLAAAAGAAGLTGFLARHRRLIFTLSALCLLVAGITAVQLRGGIELTAHGTQGVPSAALPTTIPYTLAREATHSNADGNRFQSLWSARGDRQILSTPVLANDVLIYGMYNGGLETLDAATGAPRWKLPTPTPVFALTHGPDNMIYAGEGLHETRIASLLAITPGGTVRWQRRFAGHLEEGVAFSADARHLFVGTGPGGLWSLTTKDGAVQWHAALGHIDARPLVLNARVYVPAMNEKTKQTTFYALNAQTGAVEWSLDQPGQPWGSPVRHARGDVILTSTGKGQIGVPREDDAGWAQAITTDGTLIWEVPLAGMPLQPSIHLPDKNLIIHADKTGAITALNVDDGAVAWQDYADGALHAPAAPIADGRLIAAVTYDGKFTIWRAADGKRLARWTIGKYATSSPVGAGDTVYVATAWYVYAFTGLGALR